MAAAPATYDSCVELGQIGDSFESLLQVVQSQKELFHSQVVQLQKIVVTQCRLTGVNPLAQEMAAGALAINIGKRPRDLLNPTAVSYMQSIFAVKDALGKRETREISVLCGVTATQVKDFFAGQRAKVRKLVRMSQDKAKANASQSIVDVQDDTLDIDTHVTGYSESITSVCTQTSVPANSNSICTQAPRNFSYVTTPVPGNSGTVPTVCTVVPGNSGNLVIVPAVSGNLTPVCVPIPDSRDTSTVYDAVPLNSMILTAVGTWVPVNSANFSTVQVGQLAPVTTKPKAEDGGASCLLSEEATPNIGSDDKKFLEDIFSLMRKESSFSGQVKLMEWVLQIHNSAVLSWFSIKGGITIIANWLSDAAVEEQTTVLLVIFKVLCHLPLNKAQPVQMSAILQTVNKLRFYRNAVVSNRAKTLLSRWSKMFVSSQALKNSSKYTLKNGQKEIRRQRNGEVLGDEIWSSKLDIPEEILAFAESNEDCRETEPKTTVKLLTESGEGSSKKHGLIVSASKTKERRKVLMVEHPESKTGRSPPVAKSAPSLNQSRPMSADDIQKAKMRAMYMQEKHGKNNNGASSSQSSAQKPEASQRPNGSAALKTPQPPPSRKAEGKRPMLPAKRSLDNRPVSIANQRTALTPRERTERSMNRPVRWGSPTVYTTNPEWRVVAGDHSKEAEVQFQRNSREEQEIYNSRQEIPPDPKGPWVIEPDYDDSLTPIIPIEQIPDHDSPPHPVMIPEPNSPPPAMISDPDSPPPPMMIPEPLPLPVSPLNNESRPSAPLVAASSSQSAAVIPCSVTAAAASSSAALEPVPDPDPELLQVLLRNPDIVEALTNGEGRNLSPEEVVVVLDMVKQVHAGGINNPLELPWPELEPTSLPSPTPPSDAIRAPWRPELPQFAGNRVPTIVHSVPLQTPSLPSIPAAFNNVHNNLAPQPQQHQQLPNLLPTRPPPPSYASSETITPLYNQWTLRPPSQMQTRPPAWQPAAPLPANFARRDPLDAAFDVHQATNSNYLANPNNNYNHNMYPRRNDYVHDGNPGRSREAELGFDRNRLEPRMEFDRSGPIRPEFGRSGPVIPDFDRGGPVRPEWSARRHWQYGPREEYRGGSWRQ